MGKTANVQQTARQKARERRIALDVDREARDQRIEDEAVKVFAQIDERTSAEQRITGANRKIGDAFRELLAEGLTVESIAKLVDLEVGEVRRLSKLVVEDKPAVADKPSGGDKTGTVTALPVQGADGAERRTG